MTTSVEPASSLRSTVPERHPHRRPDSMPASMSCVVSGGALERCAFEFNRPEISADDRHTSRFYRRLGRGFLEDPS